MYLKNKTQCIVGLDMYVIYNKILKLGHFN
jgi:hypothetical protein